MHSKTSQDSNLSHSTEQKRKFDIQRRFICCRLLSSNKAKKINDFGTTGNARDAC